MDGQLPLLLDDIEQPKDAPVMQTADDMDMVAMCLEYYNKHKELAGLRAQIETAGLGRRKSFSVGSVSVVYRKGSDAPGVTDYRKALEVWMATTATDEEKEAVYDSYGKVVIEKPKDACEAAGIVNVKGKWSPPKATLSIKE